MKTIAPHELYQRQQDGKTVDLIDVRTPIEFSEVHIDGAKLMPLDQFDAKPFVAEQAGRNGTPLYVICRSGSRSAKASEQLRDAGIDNVYSVEGGTSAWESAGLPVVRNRSVVSLERQVRIVAGLLVLTGVTLGWFVHPAFYGLAAFIGAGLTFAGLTNTCGMGMILAKMPWNRNQAACSA